MELKEIVGIAFLQEIVTPDQHMEASDEMEIVACDARKMGTYADHVMVICLLKEMMSYVLGETVTSVVQEMVTCVEQERGIYAVKERGIYAEKERGIYDVLLRFVLVSSTDALGIVIFD